MSYIGVPPVSGDFVVLDAITTSATASYTLQRSSVNFAPESANHMLVSLNGTIQKPNSSFTISGSTITFSSALTSSDVIDFILVLGNVNAVGVATTVADDAITDAKTNFVSTSSTAGLQIRGDGTTDGTLQLNCSQNSHGIKLKSPAHSASQSYTLTFPTTAPSADKFLKTDGSGNLSFADAGGGRATLLATTTISSSVANFDMTDVMTDTYNNYVLVFHGGVVAVDGTDLRITFFSGSGTSTHHNGSSDYGYAYQQMISSGTFDNSYNNSVSYFRPNKAGVGNASDETFNGELHFFDFRNTSRKKLIYGKLAHASSSGAAIGTRSVGIVKTTSALSGLRFQLASGNIEGGTFNLYGLE